MFFKLKYVVALTIPFLAVIAFHILFLRNPVEDKDEEEHERSLTTALPTIKRQNKIPFEDTVDDNETEILNRIYNIENINSINDRVSLYEEAYDICTKYLGSQANHITPTPSRCWDIKNALETTLDELKYPEDKIRLIEILVRWRPLDEQLEFARTYSQKDPALSVGDQFGLEAMVISNNSSEEDKVSVLRSFTSLPSDTKNNYANNVFQTYNLLHAIDSSQGYVSYEEPLLNAVNSFVIPEIPGQKEEPFILEGIPEFSNEDEYEVWAKQNPAENQLFIEALSIDSTGSSIDGLFNRLLLRLSLNGSPNTPSDFTRIIEQNTSDREMYYVLVEVHQYSNESEYVREYFESIASSNTINIRVDNLRSDPNLSNDQISAVNDIYFIYWPS